ncbi:hypothetical protein PM082_018345 [Marasmius tenuissimus]|nr:hypothetical protein PM082_018345 [Marasmius tenuissimus]
MRIHVEDAVCTLRRVGWNNQYTVSADIQQNQSSAETWNSSRKQHLRLRLILGEKYMMEGIGRKSQFGEWQRAGGVWAGNWE